MINLNRFLPYSKNRYVLNVFGEIIDCYTGDLVYEIEDGVKYVDIDWIDGYKRYELGLVVVITFFGINIPKSQWSKIVVGYVDGDKTNTLPTNIYYSFKTPIEVTDVRGFYYIPYYTKYAISKEGELISVKSGKSKSWYATKPIGEKGIRGGYRVTQIYNDRDERTNLSRHRAIALTFIDSKGPNNQLHVNHIDGVGGNDWIDNLEWVTPAENIKHAYESGLYSNKTVPILVKEYSTGIVTRYQSIAEASRDLELSHPTISSRLKDNPGLTYPDGLAFKPVDGFEWRPGFVKQRVDSEIFVKNVFTGEVFLTDNQKKAAILAGVDDKAVSYHVNKGSENPIDGFLFRRKGSGSIIWPTYTKSELDRFRENMTNR